MPQTFETGFDRLAEEYDSLWTDTAVGSHQRRAVWKWIDPLFQPDDYVLDLGCGTGVDALHFESLGLRVYGIDSSPKMVESARRRGVDAHCCEIENLDSLQLRFDGVISNFGALNCVRSLPKAASSLAPLVRPGGYLALCFLSRVCLWEMAYFVSQGNTRKAFRRLPGHAKSSLGVEVFYPSKRAVLAAFRRDFRFIKSAGIGLCVPPSYVTSVDDDTIAQLAGADRHLAEWPMFRSLSDHSLFIFQRL
jgi:SAM-dependent methyltransferase